MKKNINVKIKKDNMNGFFKNIQQQVELSEKNNVGGLIELLKSNVNNINNFEIIKEELFYGTQLMKLEEDVPAKNGLELIITVK